MTRKTRVLFFACFVAALAYWLLLLLAWKGAASLTETVQRGALLALILGALPAIFFLARLVRERSISDVENLAFTDSLTGLPNRGYFMDQLAMALARAKRQNRQAAVMFLDLDRFKVFNDTMGHAAGDRLIIEVGRRIQRQIRAGETFARLGGDEFTVLLEGLVSERAAETAARRILASLETPFLIEGHEVFAGTSIGIALSGSGQITPDELVRRADVALYEAKAAGRARYQLFAPGAKNLTVERLELDTELRTAVERGELRVYYQPEVRLSDGEIVGFEALVRWQNPSRGLLLPGDFIPEAEDLGILSSIGKWVLRQACEEAMRWPAITSDGDPLRVSVNLSPLEFRRRELIGELRAVLAETGLKPGRLTIEIVETALMENHDSTIETLHTLRSIGVHIAIDDFGAGYSSLGYLREFPIETLKIDRSFVTEIALGQADKVIVASIVTLAHGLGMDVVAEGVETPAQLRSLLALDCDRAQGFMFARPMPAEALRPFIKSRTSLRQSRGEERVMAA